MKGFVAIFLVITTSLSSADVSHLSNAQYDDESVTSTPAPPHHPYAFAYQAGRYPGHIDRSHQEISDGSGIVRGAFTYIDPRQEIRTVEYTADKDGFHPNISPENSAPKQTEAVKLATQRHLDAYNRIAERNSNGDVVVPNDSYAVAKAKERHQILFEKIAADHVRIGAELEAQRALFESTSEASIDVRFAGQ